MIIYGVNETMKKLEEMAIDTLIVYENLDYQVVDLVQEGKNKEDVVKKYLKLKDIIHESTWTDKDTKEKFIIQDYEPLIDYLGEKYKDYKCNIFYISDLSSEGH